MIPTKARPAQVNAELLEYCRKEIQTLLHKQLIRPSKSPWSCIAFYVNNNAEKERGVPRLIINYKPLNKALQWIRYPFPNKRDLLNRLFDAKVLSNRRNQKANNLCVFTLVFGMIPNKNIRPLRKKS